jgi:hypothetical protein
VYYARLFGQATPSLKQRLGVIDGRPTGKHRSIRNER